MEEKTNLKKKWNDSEYGDRSVNYEGQWRGQTIQYSETSWRFPG